MLNQISWAAFVCGIAVLLIAYYTYVGAVFYRKEIIAILFRISGRRMDPQVRPSGLLPEPAYAIMGAAAPANGSAADEGKLEFAPSDIPDTPIAGEATQLKIISEADSGLALQFAEMAAELRTLIRVVNESGESPENFGMLLGLLIQKYPDLGAPPYRQQVISYLIDESEGQFPFELSADELESYWMNH